MLFEPRLIPTDPLAAMINHASGFDDFLTAKKWITEDKIVGKTHADKVINMRWGLFYGEWNAFLWLNYESKGLKKFKDFHLPIEQYLRSEILASGLFLSGCYPDETKQFEFVVSTADLAKLKNLDKRRTMLKKMVISLEIAKKDGPIR